MKYRLALALMPLAVFAGPLFAQTDQTDPEIQKWNALEARYKAEIAAHDASKAKSQSEAADMAAKLGPLASHKTDGSVEVGSNSGKLEATLMAAEAMRQSAAEIVKGLCNSLALNGASACGVDKDNNVNQGRRLLIYTDSEKPNFDAYDAFKVQHFAISRELARVTLLKPKSRGELIEAATSPAAAFTVLDTIGNLFRSDYKLSNIDFSQTDMMLLKAIVEESRRGQLNSPIFVPALYTGLVDIKSNPAIVDLQNLEVERNTVATLADGYRAQAAKKPKNKKELEGIVAQMDAAVAAFDGFAKKLGTPDDKGNVPLSVIAKQAMIAGQLNSDTYLMIVKAEAAGGSAYAKKNFWTFLGGIPFSVSGGSMVSYTLLRGDGQVVTGGVLARTQPFSRIDAATRRYQAGLPASAAVEN